MSLNATSSNIHNLISSAPPGDQQARVHKLSRTAPFPASNQVAARERVRFVFVAPVK